MVVFNPVGIVGPWGDIAHVRARPQAHVCEPNAARDPKNPSLGSQR